MPGYSYLGNGGTDRREFLHDGMCPGCVFSLFGRGAPMDPSNPKLCAQM